MRSNPASNVLVQLRFTGNRMFSADPNWRKGASASFCPHCHNVRENVKAINAVVLPSKQLRFDIGSIGAASIDFRIVGSCGGVRVLSTNLIDLVGLEQVKRVAGLGQVADTAGKVLGRYRTAVALRDSVVTRGYRQEGAGLCKECGRLLYGARDPYVVRKGIPREPFFLSDGDVYCTNDFWNDRLLHARLARLEAVEIPILDEPQDGFPKSINDLKETLKAKRRFK
jgi:hypothetical protein